MHIINVHLQNYINYLFLYLNIVTQLYLKMDEKYHFFSILYFHNILKVHEKFDISSKKNKQWIKQNKKANCKSKNLFYFNYFCFTLLLLYLFALIVAVSYAWRNWRMTNSIIKKNCQHLTFVVFMGEEHTHIKRECPPTYCKTDISNGYGT